MICQHLQMQGKKTDAGEQDQARQPAGEAGKEQGAQGQGRQDFSQADDKSGQPGGVLGYPAELKGG